MVSPLNSILSGVRSENSLMSIGDMMRQKRVDDSNLKTQQLQQQSIQQQMGQRQQAMTSEQSLGSARYINALGKQLLSTDESQWGQILQPHLPQLQQLGYTPEILQGMTREQVAGVVAQTEPLMPSQGASSPKVLKEGERLVDPRTGELIAEGGEKTGEDQPMIDKLRSRYDNYTKDLRQVDAAYRKVKVAPESASGDMSLIFGFMKLLDPGSTVREGEFASAEQAAGVPTRVLNAYNRALKGERLSPEQRMEFKETAEGVFDAQQESADSQIATLLQQADQDGVSRVRVLGAKNLRDFEKRAADRLINNPSLGSGSNNVQVLKFDAQGNPIQ